MVSPDLQAPLQTMPRAVIQPASLFHPASGIVICRTPSVRSQRMQDICHISQGTPTYLHTYKRVTIDANAESLSNFLFIKEQAINSG
jgi:hypothetical protein